MVWICYSRIASMLPTCALPFPVPFAMCAPKSNILRSLRQGTYIGLRSVIHLLPSSMRKLPGSPYLRYIQLLRTCLTFAVTLLFLVYSSAFSI